MDEQINKPTFELISNDKVKLHFFFLHAENKNIIIIVDEH